MLIPVIAVLAGFVLLVWGAERFVLGASVLARNLGVSPLVIGLTIVGFGTSAPEMLVSVVASWEQKAGMAIGNAIGSNITNIALVLGTTAIITPLTVQSATLRRELPVLLLVMLLGLTLVIDGDLGRGDGLLLLAGLLIMIYWIVSLGLRTRPVDPLSTEYDQEMPPIMPTRRGVIWLAVGLTTLFLSSRLLVWGAVEIATWWGVSDLIIGLTVIAIGTSLPELAASIAGALKREHDIAIGNVIGSNMFNLLGVMAWPGLLAPGPIGREILVRDYTLMVALTVALLLMAYGLKGGAGRINRIEGAILVAVFIAYIYILFLTAASAAAPG